MSRPRVPTAILRARGGFITHKDREVARAGEPVETRKLGAPPKTFTEGQKAAWREFAKMVPRGVATYADRWAVELIVTSMTKFRSGAYRAADLSTISNLLARFGLTPADRSRVVATIGPKPDDEWAELDEPQQTM
jgi:hypothetical protein